MNTYDIDIELPPLPPLHIVPSIDPVDYPEVAQALKDYARAAVAADRKRRGEPVGYVSPSAIKRLKAGGNAIIGGMIQGFDVPLYIAPRPAEPDEWKLAVDHELTNMQSTADSYPSAKEAVKALIDWHVAVATDPVFQKPTEPVKIECPKCGVDRSKVPCAGVEADKLINQLKELL